MTVACIYQVILYNIHDTDNKANHVPLQYIILIVFIYYLSVLKYKYYY